MRDATRGKTIQSVQRAIDIINCFDDTNTELSLNDISMQLELNKSTVYGILNTLYQNGYITQNHNGKYMLGQSLLLKYRYAQNTNRMNLISVAKPHMYEIAKRFKLTSNLFIIEDGRPQFLHQCLPKDIIYSVRHASDNDPLYCTASGKLSLAFMNQRALDEYLSHTELKAYSAFTLPSMEALLENLKLIRKVGYAYENEELGEGVSAMSVPIYDPEMQLYGTLSTTGVSYSVERQKLEIIAQLKHTSKLITAELF